MMRLLIIEDETLLRELLVAYMKLEWPEALCGVAHDVASGIQQLGRAEWDVVLLDLSLRGRCGLEVLDYVRTMPAAPKVLVVTSHAEHDYVVRCVAGGARGFIAKDSHPRKLIDAVRTVAGGRTWLTDTAADLIKESRRRRLSGEQPEQPHAGLSNREMEILLLLGSGLSVGQIAESLSLSPKTVHTHRASILTKLGLESTAELIRYVFDHGLERKQEIGRRVSGPDGRSQ